MDMHDTDTFVDEIREQLAEGSKEDPNFSQCAALLVGADKTELLVDAAVSTEHHANASFGFPAIRTYREYFSGNRMVNHQFFNLLKSNSNHSGTILRMRFFHLVRTLLCDQVAAP